MRIPSVPFKGMRVRALFNEIHMRPERETFHEFLGCVVKWTFGRAWWEYHSNVDPADRHVVVQWAAAFSDLTQQGGRAREGGCFSSTATGTAWEWIQLGYDLFCLQEFNKLPEFLVERMRGRDTFQSARYEVRVAAIIIRAGYQDIDYLDDKGVESKHCEFFARAPHATTIVAVEAKSRRRGGVLHEPGVFDYTEDLKGVQQLYRRAKDQRPEGRPFLIFMDMNLPPTLDVPTQDKQWFKDLKRAMGCRPEPSEKNRDPFTVLYATNFSNHFLAKDRAYASEWGNVISMFPEHALDMRSIEAVTRVVEDYYRVPAEV